MSIKGVMGFKVACAQIERSIAFYGRLGFAPAGAVSESAHAWLADLYGVRDGRLRAQAMVRPEDPKGLRLELLEWADRAEGPGAANATGLGMLMLRSDDVVADSAALRQAGAATVSEPVALPGPTGTTWLVNVRDPDGFALQLVQFVRAA